MLGPPKSIPLIQKLVVLSVFGTPFIATYTTIVPPLNHEATYPPLIITHY
jgi:hypothetical protein